MGRFPSILEVLVSFPMDKVVGSVGAVVVSENSFRDKLFLGFEFDGRGRILVLIDVAGGVREEKRDVEDGVDLKGRRKVEDEGDWGELFDDGEGTEVSSVELEGGTGGGDVSGVEPDEVSDGKEIHFVPVLVESDRSSVFPVVVLLLEVLSVEDGVVDRGMDFGESEDFGVGGGVVGCGGEEAVGRGEGVIAVIREEGRFERGGRAGVVESEGAGGKEVRPVRLIVVAERPKVGFR